MNSICHGVPARTPRLPALLAALLLCCGCAGVRPLDATDYGDPALAPEIRDDLMLVERHVYDDPLLGVRLQYLDRTHPADILQAFVYPVGAVDWADRQLTLDAELSRALADVDAAIDRGAYVERGPEHRTDLVFEVDGRLHVGRKARFRLELAPGQVYDSDIYLFLAGDKFVKFRTSFDVDHTVDWTGDAVVEALLPLIEVPPESVWMQARREGYRAADRAPLDSWLADSRRRLRSRTLAAGAGGG